MYKLFPYQLFLKICTLLDILYSSWIRNSFKRCEGFIRRGASIIRSKNIIIGKKTNIGYHCVLSVWNENANIIIDDNVNIGDYCHITAINNIHICDGVLTGRFVTISDNSHGSSSIDDMKLNPYKRTITSKGTIEIGKNVWIGDKATILSGVKIGEGSIVAANAVVTKNVPAFCVVAGVPATIIKQL